MARSPKQIANSMRVIAVAAIAKEFRKSAIIERIKTIAKNKGMVYTGELSNKGLLEKVSNDNDWLVRRNAVVVNVGPIEGGVPSYVEIVVNLTEETKIKKKYFYLTEYSDNKKWMPNVDKIAAWVRGKGIESGEKEVRRAAWAISKHLSKKGIKKTNVANPLKYKRTGVDATIDRGLENAANRITELYGELVVDAVVTTFDNLDI